MSVTVASCTLADIFSGKPVQDDEGHVINGDFVIPEYQRPYCWTHENILRLLDDYEQSQTHNSCDYYLGSLILHQQGSSLSIIDGQQRLTTMGLVYLIQASQWLQQAPAGNRLTIQYHSPISQANIAKNLQWLKSLDAPQQQRIDQFDLGRVSVTLVVTESEDDAYRFFETQNTGGVRLTGADIIKAHHLRAIPSQQQDHFAKLWEQQGELSNLIGLLLKARYWQKLEWRSVPSKREPFKLRTEIVKELATNTEQGGDVSYANIRTERHVDGTIAQFIPQQGYALRQPLNAGVNTAHYIAYFCDLHRRYLSVNNSAAEDSFAGFYHKVCEFKGCDYLKQLYDACLLLYISQFGEDQLPIIAKKLFRVVYSKRVSAQKTVREASIPAFLKEYPVLDWISESYTPKQCAARLDSFSLKVETSNTDGNGVKARFIKQFIAINGEEHKSPLDNEKSVETFKAMMEEIRQQTLVKTIRGSL